MNSYNARMLAVTDIMPRRLKQLPITEEGWPQLYFAAIIDGKPDLRIADAEKKARCDSKKLCWICGQPLGRMLVGVLGPMCVITRTTSEPPQHLECATFAARVCPFLVRPLAKRNTTGVLADPAVREAPGVMIDRNPGCCAVYVTREFTKFRVSNGYLYRVGDPTSVEWYCEGRPAKRAEIEASIYSGLPLLEAQCEKERNPEAARKALLKRQLETSVLLPAA